MKYKGNDPRNYTQNIGKKMWAVIGVVYVVGTIWALIITVGFFALIIASLFGYKFN